MLAHDSANHEKKLVGKKLLEPKLDGVRCVTIVDYEAKSVTQYTRNGKVLENFEKLDIDACCIERVSRDWATSFMQQVDRRKYLLNFHKTTIGNESEGGSVSIRRAAPQCCTIDHVDTITLPSSKPQPDGGQPGCLHVFEWNGYKFIMGCMPQNLGRDGTKNFDKQKYFDVIDQFWPNRKDLIDIIPIAIWHEPHNAYQTHVWQLDIEDAIADLKGR